MTEEIKKNLSKCKYIYRIYKKRENCGKQVESEEYYND